MINYVKHKSMSCILLALILCYHIQFFVWCLQICMMSLSLFPIMTSFMQELPYPKECLHTRLIALTRLSNHLFINATILLEVLFIVFIFIFLLAMALRCNFLLHPWVMSFCLNFKASHEAMLLKWHQSFRSWCRCLN